MIKMTEQNYYIKTSKNTKKVSLKEYLEYWDKLRAEEKRIGKTLFYGCIDYNDSYIMTKW